MSNFFVGTTWAWVQGWHLVLAVGMTLIFVAPIFVTAIMGILSENRRCVCCIRDTSDGPREIRERKFLFRFCSDHNPRKERWLRPFLRNNALVTISGLIAGSSPLFVDIRELYLDDDLPTLQKLGAAVDAGPTDTLANEIRNVTSLDIETVSRNHPDFLLTCARAFAAMGQLRQAHDCLNRLLDRFKYDESAMSEKAVIHYHLENDYNACLSQCNDVLRHHPGSSAGRCYRGLAAVGLALEDVHHPDSIQVNEAESPPPLSNEARQHLEAAVKDLRDVLTSQGPLPSRVSAGVIRVHLANALHWLGRFQESFEVIRDKGSLVFTDGGSDLIQAIRLRASFAYMALYSSGTNIQHARDAVNACKDCLDVEPASLQVEYWYAKAALNLHQRSRDAKLDAGIDAEPERIRGLASSWPTRFQDSAFDSWWLMLDILIESGDYNETVAQIVLCEKTTLSRNAKCRINCLLARVIRFRDGDHAAVVEWRRIDRSGVCNIEMYARDYGEALARLARNIEKQRGLPDVDQNRNVELLKEQHELGTEIESVYHRYCERVESSRPVVVELQAHSHNGIGLGLYHQHKLREALISFRRAVELAPDNELFLGNAVHVETTLKKGG